MKKNYVRPETETLVCLPVELLGKSKEKPGTEWNFSSEESPEDKDKVSEDEPVPGTGPGAKAFWDDGSLWGD